MDWADTELQAAVRDLARQILGEQPKRWDAVVEAGLIPLAIIGVINSLISVYYYLRLLVVMYMKEPAEDSYAGREMVSVMMSSVLALIIIVLGVVPDAFHRMALIIFRQIRF